MTFYDYVVFPCSCGKNIKIKTQKGNCDNKEYPYTKVPSHMCIGINKEAPFVCVCGKKWKVDLIVKVACRLQKLIFEEVK